MGSAVRDILVARAGILVSLSGAQRNARRLDACRLSAPQLRVLATAYDRGEWLPVWPRNGHDYKILDALARKGLAHRSAHDQRWYLTDEGRRRVRAALGGGKR